MGVADAEAVVEEEDTTEVLRTAPEVDVDAGVIVLKKIEVAIELVEDAVARGAELAAPVAIALPAPESIIAC